MTIHVIMWRPSQGVCGTGGKGHSFQGNLGKRKYWGTGSKRKQILDFWGTSQFISGQKGNRYPPPLPNLGGPRSAHRRMRIQKWANVVLFTVFRSFSCVNALIKNDHVFVFNIYDLFSIFAVQNVTLSK